MSGFVKQRDYAPPGSIPDVLDMFRSEVRFYQEVAEHVGLRVPACYEADAGQSGIRLVLEDLSAWEPGADPVAVAVLLAGMHQRFEGRPATRWPWLRPVGAAADLVGDLYDRLWPSIDARSDLPSEIRGLGARLVGHIADAERGEADAGPLTLIHGDASLRNVRTAPGGEIAFLDWEDVREAPGAADLAWLLVSSVTPSRWPDVIAAYGPCSGLAHALPAAIGQGLLSLIDTSDGSTDATGWLERLEAAASRLA